MILLQPPPGASNTGRVRWPVNADTAGTVSATQVLCTIRNHDGITRADISRITGLGRSTVSQHVDTLVSGGLVVETGSARSTGGRRARLLRFRKDGGYVVAVDLGATSLDVGICNLDAEPVAVDSMEFDQTATPNQAIESAHQMAAGLIRGMGLDFSQISGVGLGVPGPVQFSTGTLVAPAILRGWDKYPIATALRERFGCAAYVDNDVNVMALGELWAGIGKGVRNFIFVKLGTGIGAGIVCEGQLYRGSQGCAGDIGHIVIDGCDVVCLCGKRGCLEALAAGPSIARRAEAEANQRSASVLSTLMSEHGRLTAEDVGMAALRGDSAAAEIIRDTGRLVGRVLAKVIDFFNPSLILIGGGISKTGDLLLASIRESVYQQSLPLATRDLSVLPSALGDRAGIIGAAVLVLEELYSPPAVAQVIAQRLQQ